MWTQVRLEVPIKMTSRLPRTFNNLKNRCYTTKTIARNVAFAKHVGWLTEKALNVCEWAIPVYLVGIPVCTLAGIATGAYVGGCEEYRNPSTTAIFRGASTSGIKGALVGLGIGDWNYISNPCSRDGGQSAGVLFVLGYTEEE